ncbi:hypothetical protein MJ524_18245 [Escherichia coli]|nr:hypothetical protein MJ524_18245 [Escherichia coli]
MHVWISVISMSMTLAAFSRLGAMLDQKNRITINYFAMPPSTFGAICKGLGEGKTEC